ncbi:MAG: hypothetical protein HYR62_02875 [Actinobacteria bacterium]|nr:hypothetical protein [Actinomycetota bacterium]MBI3687413.1 hypothetical protein [Actinomycetota bacterium]
MPQKQSAIRPVGEHAPTPTATPTPGNRVSGHPHHPRAVALQPATRPPGQAPPPLPTHQHPSGPGSPQELISTPTRRVTTGIAVPLAAPETITR